MKTRHYWLVIIFLLTSTLAQAGGKPVLTVNRDCVEGLVLKFEDRAGDFGKDAAVDIPIAQFDEKDYEIINGQDIAGLPRDSFGYPRACTIFDKMAEEAREGKK